MSFVKDILNISEEFTGILFENNKIKIIKLKKESENFFPVYWNSIDFDLDNLLKKTDMITLFKKIKSDLKTEKINFDLIHWNKKNIEKEILSNLKIAGFQKINLINWDYNIDYLTIDNKNIEKNIFIFSPDDIHLEINYVEDNHIYKKEVLKISDLSPETIEHFFKETCAQHIFLSGYFKNNLEDIKSIFYSLGKKVHVFNIWKNILSFEKNIPALFKNESHKYIKVISLALPRQNIIEFIKEKEKIPKTKKIKMEGKIDVDFIIDNKKDTEIISEKNTLWQKIKDIFNVSIFGPKNSKSFVYHYEENHILNKKIYLPKPKVKLFLPKPKSLLENKYSFKLVKKDKKELLSKNDIEKRKKEKNIFLKKPLQKLFLPKWNKNIFDKVIFGPQRCESFKYFYNKDSILNKDIESIILWPSLKNSLFQNKQENKKNRKNKRKNKK